jgi:hypothetical protein
MSSSSVSPTAPTSSTELKAEDLTLRMQTAKDY